MSFECECPICPLAKMNLQLCDFKIKLFETYYQTSYDKEEYDLNKETIKNLVLIALWARNEKKIRKNKCLNYESDDAVLCVEGLTKNHFKICFHAKNPKDEDPE